LAVARGVRLTPVRRRVLEILLEEHKAMGAYDVLTRLAAEGFGNQPPVAYRALEFLEDQGFAHRIRRRAFGELVAFGCEDEFRSRGDGDLGVERGCEEQGDKLGFHDERLERAGSRILFERRAARNLLSAGGF
jgi:hypothetical protein